MKLKEVNQGQQNGCPSSSNVEQVILNLLDKMKPLEDGVPETNKELIVKIVEHIKIIAKQNGIFFKSTDFGSYTYTGTHWEKIEDYYITILLREAMLKCGVGKIRGTHFKTLGETLNQFKTSFISPPLEHHKDLVNLKSGTFNVITGELQKHSHKNNFTYTLNYEYNPEANCPMFLSFLDRILPSKDLQAIIQEFAGWIFSDLKLEKALMLFGVGANGKSVLMEILSEIVGKDMVVSFDLETLTDADNPSIYKYSQARLNICTDISPSMKNSAMFKRLVSNEPMEAKILYKGYVSVYPNTKLIFSMNSLLDTNDMSDGFFRRCLIIPFNQTIPEWERDKLLAKKIISSELSGIFNWVLEGRKRIEKNQSFTESSAIEDILDEYRLKSDSVASFLEITGYIQSKKYMIVFKEIYEQYLAYCYQNGYIPESNKSFGKRLDEIGFERRIGTGNKLYVYAEDETRQKLP